MRAESAERTCSRALGLLCVAMASLSTTIRSGQAEDLSAVLALLRGAKLPTDGMASAPDLQFWVLEAGQSLVGVIGMERFGASALLRSLAIAPAYQRQGLGHKLVASLERNACSKGIEQLVLLTETAEAFFKGIGFEVVDRRSVSDEIKQSAEVRSLCPASAVCMTKSVLA